MWKRVTNSNDVKPHAIDESISRQYIYVRKDFEQVTITDEMTGEEFTRWSYLETTVPKEVFDIYQATVTNASSIADLEDVICELTAE